MAKQIRFINMNIYYVDFKITRVGHNDSQRYVN